MKVEEYDQNQKDKTLDNEAPVDNNLAYIYVDLASKAMD